MSMPITIKQIMPIDHGYIVLSRVEDGDGISHMENLAFAGWHYMYVLVDGGEYAPDVPLLYEIDPEGHGGIDDGTSRIVPHRKCPVCGYDMSPRWDDEDDEHLNYYCVRCAYLRRKAKENGGGLDVHQSFYR
jgi:hypothetical protein